MNIVFADKSHFEGIYKLWGSNRATLGLMPKDAFIDCINKKWIIINLNEDDEVDAYLQYRYTNRTQALSIVHLCVDKSNRGKGISEKLIDKLVDTYKKKARGIKLNCRSDYESAIKFWQRYNFQPKGTMPSRGSDPNVVLITWWFNFGQQDLFSFTTTDKIKAVLDFNVIAKLRDQHSVINSMEEVMQLQSDWLASEVEYYQTSETLSEIFRDQNLQRNIKSKSFIQQFKELNIDKTSINKLECELKEIFSGQTANDRSDRRQLAEMILSGVQYFITLDDGILKHKKEISSKYHVKIVSPSSFILEIDASINAADYYPNRLSGENFSINKVTSDEKDYILSYFLNTGSSEKKSDFLILLNRIISSEKGDLRTIKENNIIVATIGSLEDDDKLIVPLIRIKLYYLKKTIFMQCVYDLINLCVRRKKNFLIINDISVTHSEIEILENYGFYFREGLGYIKAVCSQLSTTHQLTKNLSNFVSYIPEVAELIQQAINERQFINSFYYSYFLEKQLWPLKIEDADIPCFIIPIKPIYAKHLFDINSANQDLFGVTPHLIWNKENVYYRNVRPNTESYPARILWYASSDENSYRQKSIICSSYLDEIIIGSAKKNYTKFKKFGVYDWDRDIKPLAKGDAEKDIKILRFSNSEPFDHPVQLKIVKSILKKYNEKDNNFQSPLRIKPITFMEIYSLAKFK